MKPKKLDAMEVLIDLRNGMSNSEIMSKYNLSNLGLKSLYRKLQKAMDQFLAPESPVPQKEVSLKEVLKDIKAGNSPDFLREKYQLSSSGLKNLFLQLEKAGLLSGHSGKEEHVNEICQHRENESASPERNGSQGPTNHKASYSYSGQVQEIDILDYIQWMLIDCRQTVLEIRQPNSASTRIFVDAGKILHVDSFEVEGEEAFYSCVLPPSGEFFHLPWSPPSKITVEKSGIQLVFEAARRRDEANA